MENRINSQDLLICRDKLIGRFVSYNPSGFRQMNKMPEFGIITDIRLFDDEDIPFFAGFVVVEFEDGFGNTYGAMPDLYGGLRIYDEWESRATI